MDNPERRTNFGLLAGNANNHAYFGLSCCFTKLKLSFEACSKCQKALSTYCLEEGWMRESPPSPHCKKCHAFSLNHLLRYGMYKEPIFQPPEGMNDSDFPGSNLFSKPGCLTNHLLINSYIAARDLFLSGKLTENNVREYLNVLCYNTKTIDDLIERCYLYQMSLDVKSGSADITEDDRMEVALAEEDYPDRIITKPSPPAMLFICDIDCAIETMMHLSMNICKQCETVSFLWAKDMPKFSCVEMISGV